MIDELLEAIASFRSAQELALAYVHERLGLPVPRSNREWMRYAYAVPPAAAVVANTDGVKIDIHGAGIEVVHRISPLTMTMDPAANATASMPGDLHFIDTAVVAYHGRFKGNSSCRNCLILRRRAGPSFRLPTHPILYTRISDQIGRPLKQTDNQDMPQVYLADNMCVLIRLLAGLFTATSRKNALLVYLGVVD